MCHDHDTFHDTQLKCVMIHDTFVDTFLDTVQKRVPAIGQIGALKSEIVTELISEGGRVANPFRPMALRKEFHRPKYLRTAGASTGSGQYGNTLERGWSF